MEGKRSRDNICSNGNYHSIGDVGDDKSQNKNKFVN